MILSVGSASEQDNIPRMLQSILSDEAVTSQKALRFLGSRSRQDLDDGL